MYHVHVSEPVSQTANYWNSRTSKTFKVHFGFQGLSTVVMWF